MFGPANPYPSTRTVAGETGLITDLNVGLDGVFHSHPDDMDIMLEKVGGPRVMLMSDACGSFAMNGYSLRWDDEAGAKMVDNGTTSVCGFTSDHRPTDHNPGDSLPSPSPQAPYSTSLSDFDLLSPNGEWRLWVNDDASGFEGFVTTKFVLEYQTRPPAAAPTPAGDPPPETTIDRAPRRKSPKRKATIRFSADDGGGAFECQLDRRPFRPCASPKRLRNLDVGKHRFRVRALDAAGNSDPTPAKASWAVTRSGSDLRRAPPGRPSSFRGGWLPAPPGGGGPGPRPWLPPPPRRLRA